MKRLVRRAVLALLGGVLIGGAVVAWKRAQRPVLEIAPGPAPAPLDAKVAWLKGQLHARSNGSGDSNTPPEDVLRWYGEHGFDFVVFTDHNRVTQVPSSATTLAIPGIELTQNFQTCDPPPPPEAHACLLHVNAWFVHAPAEPIQWPPFDAPTTRVRHYEAALDAARKMGALAQVNHPNLEYGASADVLDPLVRGGLRFLEVENEAVDSNNEGDATHPSTEAIWDELLGRGLRVWATATDDAHHYYDAEATKARGEDVFTGDRGFVMVHAAKDPESIRAALERGDFYGSSGVRLSELSSDATRLSIKAADASPGELTFTFIGEGGRVLATDHGREATFDLSQAQSRYVRAVVSDAQGRKAWTQPVFLDSRKQ